MNVQISDRGHTKASPNFRVELGMTKKDDMRTLRPQIDIVNGKYAIDRVVGKVALGTLYLAHEVSGAGRTVLLRHLTGPLSPESRSKLAAELKGRWTLLSRTEHETIAPTFDFVLDQGVPTLVEEFVNGKSLKQLIEEGKALGRNEFASNPLLLAQIALKLARGLETLQGLNMLHGSITPESVIFRDSSTSQPCLIGACCGEVCGQLALANYSSEPIATLVYLPPERTGFLEHEVGPERDLYSLGATLYEAATGHPPFTGANTKEIVQKILSVQPWSLSACNSAVPETLSRIFDKLLRKNPNSRYQSATGLATDLEICCDYLAKGEPIPQIALGRRDEARELNPQVKMVGRQSELDRLVEALNIAKSEHHAAMLIGAPSGMGKSRLSGEFLKMVAAQEIPVMETKYSEFERNVPLSAISALLTKHAESLNALRPEQVEQWSSHVSALLGNRGRLITKRFPFYERYLADLPPLPKMPLEEESQMFLRALAEFVSSLHADAGTKVIFFDDLQWADETSLKLIREIIKLSSEAGSFRVFVLSAYRSDEVGDDHPLRSIVFKSCPTAQHIALAPLSLDETGTLLEQLLDEQGSVLTVLKEQAFQFTAGNPFFVREFLKSVFLASKHYFDKNESRWNFERATPPTLAMSKTVVDLVATRITRLPREVLGYLTTASVAGSTVLLDDLARLLSISQQTECSPKTLQASFENLSDENLVTISDRSITFFHDKIREAAYKMLSSSDRELIHQTYANILAQNILTRSNTNSVSSKAIFEAAHHASRGRPQELPTVTRKILILAGERAIGVFAYARAKEYLELASSLFGTDKRALPLEEIPDWVNAHEFLADTLVLSESLIEAIALYQDVLEHTSDRMRRAKILGKMMDCHFSLFHYSDCMKVGRLAMAEVNASLPASEIVALLLLPLQICALLVTILAHLILPSKTLRPLDQEADEQISLLAKILPALYFATPLIAASGACTTMRRLVPRREDPRRALMVAYCGVVLASFGFARLSKSCFSHAHEFYERFPNPVNQGFLFFVWGQLLDFPTGHLKEAHAKFQIAEKLLSSVGESFWRALALQSSIHLDQFGLGNGDTERASQQLFALVNRFKAEPTILNATLKHLLNHRGEAEQQQLQARIIDALERNLLDGFETLDSVYGLFSSGEAQALCGDNQKALSYLRQAFRISFRHVHRAALCCYPAIPYAAALVRNGNILGAVGPLSFAWLNVLLGVHVFIPQTWYATAEFLAALQLDSLARSACRRGLKFAREKQFQPIVAEGRIVMARVLANDDPDMARMQLLAARQYFLDHSLDFQVRDVDRRLFSIPADETEQTEGSTYPAASALTESSQRETTGHTLREQVEMSVILDILLRLSAITETPKLLDAVLDALCSCSGANAGVIFLPEGQAWMPKCARDIQTDAMTSALHEQLGLSAFLKNTQPTEYHKPWVYDLDSPRLNLACSALALPFVYKGKMLGLACLWNSLVPNLFDARCLDVIGPLAAQAAVALQNIAFINERAELERNAANEKINAVLSLADRFNSPVTTVTNVAASLADRAPILSNGIDRLAADNIVNELRQKILREMSLCTEQMTLRITMLKQASDALRKLSDDINSHRESEHHLEFDDLSIEKTFASSNKAKVA